jgi:DNA integrity scanning protein DisA with diadenylate cyclase activity
MSSIDNMVGLTLEDSKSEVDYVLMLSNSARKVKLVHDKIDSRKPLKVLTSQSRTFEILQEDGLEVTLSDENLSAKGLGVLNRIHDLIISSLSDSDIKVGMKILVVLADPIDGVFIVDFANLHINKLIPIAQEFGVEIEVLNRLIDLAQEIGGKGREGHDVGALFALGNIQKLRKHSTALVLNPFKGHPADKRSILEDKNLETLAEFAWLDGAIFFNKEGIASDAGRYIQVPPNIPAKSGEGGRELAARGISSLTDSIAVSISTSGRITMYAKGRQAYQVRMK